MRQHLGCVTLLVPDYDEALAWYAGVLGFRIVADDDLGGGKRWVVVAPPGGATGLLLARADTREQERWIGDQVGGRVLLFLHTDDFARDHAAYRSRGVEFIKEPRHEPYGIVAVFKDRYGNLWDLIQPRA